MEFLKWLRQSLFSHCDGLYNMTKGVPDRIMCKYLKDEKTGENEIMQMPKIIGWVLPEMTEKG